MNAYFSSTGTKINAGNHDTEPQYNQLMFAHVDKEKCC